MTPRMAYALQCRHLLKLQREEWLFGVVATEVANGSFNRRKKNVDPEYFMLHPPESRQKDAAATNDDFLAQLEKLPGAVRVDTIP